MTREEMDELVETIRTVRDKKTNRVLSEKEHHALVMKFKRSVKHPGGTDLIYYSQLVGPPSEPTVEEIVELAMKRI